MDFAFLKQYLKEYLSQQRYQHSLDVMDTMGELAEIYGLNKESAQLSGLLHDITKEWTDDEHVAYIMQYCGRDVIDAFPYGPYLHGVTAAHFIETQFGVKDHDVLWSVKNHVAIRPIEGTLNACQIVGDALPVFPDWPGRRKLKDLIYAGELDRSVLLILHWIIEIIPIKHGIIIHPNIVDNYNMYLQKCPNVDKEFFCRE